MNPRLSLCVATLNRADYLQSTLERLVPALSEEVELVVVDGASSDNTQAVVESFADRCEQVRYFREADNGGVDQDYDKSVVYARGEYCWLISDDDLLAEDALQQVLRRLEGNPSLVIVNSEQRSADLALLLAERSLPIESDEIYPPEAWQELCARIGRYLSFIGCVVIRREIWIHRERKRYYGSLFIHCGVIFQAPLPGQSVVVADPLIRIRLGNAMWTHRSFQIWMFLWPGLIWSFDSLYPSTKKTIVARYPWQKLGRLALTRSLGRFTWRENRELGKHDAPLAARLTAFALLAFPSKLVNAALAVFILFFMPRSLPFVYEMQMSKSGNFVSRFVFSRLLRRRAGTGHVS